MVRIEWIVWRSSHDRDKIFTSQFLPQRFHPASVLWGSYDDHAGLALIV
jgi:hypothetical protein